MKHIISSKIYLFALNKSFSPRHISKYIQKEKSSKAIRDRFLEYFIKDNNHKFIKSSPVVPYCDPTVAFVNAGMNQFKGVFLGTQTLPYNRIANSQKCIRVGGKHNDLITVGTDGYHHTFFEMLGNWSFGDYFKAEACEMAWNLLTKVYNIPATRLYVTYFNGDDKLGLESDNETREIWRKIGVKDSRIIPFGMKDNFWEMGLTGPCGPCTEIHVDHLGDANRSQFINKGLQDLTEVWNLVFIEYNRTAEGNITPLPKKHVDTGLGFERLTSFLQGKISNYDTDNFTYILDAIHKNCSELPPYRGNFGEKDWNNLDTSYRVLADHTRMVAVALADGVIPEQNYKLRKILRKGFLLSETVFQKEKGLMQELTNYVIDKLGPVYPELERNVLQIQQIIDYEEDVYKSIRKSTEKELKKLNQDNPNLQTLDPIDLSSSFISAFKELSSQHELSQIDNQLAFKLYDTFGLDEELISNLADILKLKFDPNDLSTELQSVKLRSKQQSALEYKHFESLYLPETNDSYKYLYKFNNDSYIFPSLEVKLLKNIENSEGEHTLILDKTSLYHEAGGQTCDKGIIHFNGTEFYINSLEKVGNHIFHKGYFKNNGKSDVNENDDGILQIDNEIRLNTMRNHTATHLLNACIKDFKGATCQKSSRVTDDELSLDVAIFGKKITSDEVVGIEEKISELIRKGVAVKVMEVDSNALYNYDKVTLIPGEIYPENGIRIVEVEDFDSGFVSREPCCGTHVLNTSHIQDFCIIGMKSLGRSTVSLTAVTGDHARTAKHNAHELFEQISEIANAAKNSLENQMQSEFIEKSATEMKQNLLTNKDNYVLPIAARQESIKRLEDVIKSIKDTSKGQLNQIIKMEMLSALDSNVKLTNSQQKYLVHFLRSSMVLENVQLQKVTKYCTGIPVLVISYCDGIVKARCCVPENMKKENFDAYQWILESVVKVFNSKASPTKIQNGLIICNMNAKRVHLQDWDTLLDESVQLAQKFVEENL